MLEEYTRDLTVQTFHYILCKSSTYILLTILLTKGKKKRKQQNVTEDSRNTHIKTAFPGQDLSSKYILSKLSHP